MTDAFSRSRISLTLADMQRPDAPLIGLNDAFSSMTGYSPAQALGRNCRFLQPSGGAGPVRARMREFLKDDVKEQDRFVVPNIRIDGGKFLNLVYMTKLRRDGKTELVLGSQFDITLGSPKTIDLYDTALCQDIRDIGKVAGEYGLIVVGTYESLVSSNVIIAKARLEQSENWR